MSENNEKLYKESCDISELNNRHNKNYVRHSLEPANSKPIDISLMTGNNEQNKKGSDEK